MFLKTKKKEKQKTFIYCPKSNTELIKNGQFIEDNDGIVKYCCSECGTIAFWDFGNFSSSDVKEKTTIFKGETNEII